MSNITVCKVLNKFDESNSENIVVCSVWEDGKLKVYILKSDSIMLFGEEVTEQLEKFAKTFDKTLDAYIQETKDILCGMKSDVDFFLTSSKFYWKRKRPLGQINMNPIKDVGCLTSFLLILVDEYSKNKNKLDDMEKDYHSVKLVNSDLVQKLSDFQSIKDQLEDGLYKKFTLLLNSKKAKIKDLSNQLKKLEDRKNIFNDSTDGSESESEIKNNTSSHSSPKSNQKRALGKKTDVKSSFKRKKKTDKTDNFEALEKRCFKEATIVDAVEKDEPTPSTSNDMKNLDEDEETPDLLSGDSDCDFVLKLDEDKLDDGKTKESAINEQDSEEMF